MVSVDQASSSSHPLVAAFGLVCVAGSCSDPRRVVAIHSSSALSRRMEQAARGGPREIAGPDVEVLRPVLSRVRADALADDADKGQFLAVPHPAHIAEQVSRPDAQYARRAVSCAGRLST